MPDAAIAKVEVALADVLADYAALSDWTIHAEPEPDVAISPGSIVVYTKGYRTAQSEEQGQTRHEADVFFEAVSAGPVTGGIGRANQEALAHVIAALAADRTLGGLIEDIQEEDVAPVEAETRDVAAASLKTTVTFYTPRDDWFTVIGVGGVEY